MTDDRSGPGDDTNDELARLVQAFSDAFAARVRIVRVIVEPDGTVSGHIERGSFYAPPDPNTTEADGLLS